MLILWEQDPVRDLVACGPPPIAHRVRLPHLDSHRAQGAAPTSALLWEQDPVRDSVGDFDLVVFDLDHGGAAEDFQEDGDAFAGYALDEAFDAAQGGVFEANGLAGLEVAQFQQGGVVAVFFEQADAPNEFVVDQGGLKAEAHDGGDAFGVAHHRDALFGLAGAKQDVAREHGLELRHGTLLCFFEFFIERQISFKCLLFEIDSRNLFLPGLGIGQVPAVECRVFCARGIIGLRKGHGDARRPKITV